MWYDDHLFRKCAMNSNDIKFILEQWAEFGFEAMEVRYGKQVWKDVCVIESMYDGPTLPCDWLIIGSNKKDCLPKGNETRCGCW